MTTLDRLYDTILSRRNADPEISYTASLFAGGCERLAQKVGEESIELIIAAGKMSSDDSIESRKELIGEAADLTYHYLALIAWFDVSPEDVDRELERRLGQSGIDEKKGRVR